MTQDTTARYSLLAAAALGFLTVGSGMAIFGPSLPVFARQFSLTTAEAGWLVSIQWTGCLLGVAAMYFLSERVSALPGLLGIAAGMGLLALAGSWPLVIAGGFVFGLGYGAIAALFNPRILVSFGPRGPSMMSLINAVFSLGSISAPYGFVLMGGDPQPVFAALVVLALVTAAFAWRAGMTGQAPATAERRPVQLHWPILGLILLAIGIEVSLAGLGPTALIRMGLDETQAASLLSVFFVVALATRLALIAVADRVPAFGMYTFAAFWASLCSFGVIFLGPTLAFPALGVSVGLFFQGGYVSASRKMGDTPQVAAIILGTGLVGAVLSPLVYARLMDGMGPHGLFWLVGCVAGGMTIIALARFRAMVR